MNTGAIIGALIWAIIIMLALLAPEKQGYRYKFNYPVVVLILVVLLVLGAFINKLFF